MLPALLVGTVIDGPERLRYGNAGYLFVFPCQIYSKYTNITIHNVECLRTGRTKKGSTKRMGNVTELQKGMLCYVMLLIYTR